MRCFICCNAVASNLRSCLALSPFISQQLWLCLRSAKHWIFKLPAPEPRHWPFWSSLRNFQIKTFPQENSRIIGLTTFETRTHSCNAGFAFETHLLYRNRIVTFPTSDVTPTSPTTSAKTMYHVTSTSSPSSEVITAVTSYAKVLPFMLACWFRLCCAWIVEPKIKTPRRALYLSAPLPQREIAEARRAWRHKPFFPPSRTRALSPFTVTSQRCSPPAWHLSALWTLLRFPASARRRRHRFFFSLTVFSLRRSHERRRINFCLRSFEPFFFLLSATALTSHYVRLLQLSNSQCVSRCFARAFFQVTRGHHGWKLSWVFLP